MSTLKSGVDYFPLDVHIDDKLELIEAEFGLVGFAVVVKLWQKIYAGLGYYCEWNDEVALLFAKKNYVGGNVVSEILDASIRRGIFDKELYDKYGVLTSKGIQKRYLNIVKRRKKIEFFGEYLLISVPEDMENVYIKAKNAYINPENVNKSKQSKVKESKVKKSNVKESKAASADAPARRRYGEYDNVLLSDTELNKLKAEYPDKYSDYIERVSAYCASTGKTYNNYCAAIKNWILRDNEKQQEQPKRQKSAFNNFEGRKYNYDELEEKLIDMMFEETN